MSVAAEDRDWLLEDLLDVVSATGVPQPITVFCGGFGVSGNAVPEEVYFRRIGLEKLAEDVVNERESTDRRRAAIAERQGRDDLEDDERRSLDLELESMRRQFVVMVDVAIFGGGSREIRSTAWRGRLSEVHSWVIGNLAAP
jgi:hypothetical protein